MPRSAASQAQEASSAARVLRRLGELHSSPPVVLRILELTRDPHATTADLARCVEMDPALTARILRMLNSSHYGLRGHVSSVRQAVGLLGQRSLRLIALSFALTEGLTRGAGRQVYLDYWRRALTMAVAASHLASTCRGEVNRDEAYTAGLLADVGVLALGSMGRESFAVLIGQHPHGTESIAAERQCFGVGHPALGEQLLQAWGVPQPLSAAVGAHHDDEPCDEPLAVITQIASLLASAIWIKQANALPHAQRLARLAIGLSGDALVDLLLDCRAAVLEQAELFSVQIGEFPDCEAVVETARRQTADLALEIAMEMDSLTSLHSDCLT